MIKWSKLKRIIKHRVTKKEWANPDVKLTKQDKELFDLIFEENNLMISKISNTKSRITYYYCSYINTI